MEGIPHFLAVAGPFLAQGSWEAWKDRSKLNKGCSDGWIANQCNCVECSHMLTILAFLRIEVNIIMLGGVVIEVLKTNLDFLKLITA